jgi:hypothetical protein
MQTSTVSSPSYPFGTRRIVTVPSEILAPLYSHELARFRPTPATKRQYIPAHQTLFWGLYAAIGAVVAAAFPSSSGSTHLEGPSTEDKYCTARDEIVEHISSQLLKESTVSVAELEKLRVGLKSELDDWVTYHSRPRTLFVRLEHDFKIYMS